MLFVRYLLQLQLGVLVLYVLLHVASIYNIVLRAPLQSLRLALDAFLAS